MAGGDEAAYRQFYDAYFDRLLRYLLVVTGGNEEAAREALQLALVRVVRHVKTFETEEKFWSWLTVLARSAFADESRKRGGILPFGQVHAASGNRAVCDGQRRGGRAVACVAGKQIDRAAGGRTATGRTKIHFAPVRREMRTDSRRRKRLWNRGFPASAAN